MSRNLGSGAKLIEGSMWVSTLRVWVMQIMKALSLVLVIMVIANLRTRVAVILVGMTWSLCHAGVASKATYFNITGLDVPPAVEAALNIISILLAALSVGSGAITILELCKSQPSDLPEGTDQAYTRLNSAEPGLPASAMYDWREPNRSISQDSANSVTLMMENLAL